MRGVRCCSDSTICAGGGFRLVLGITLGSVIPFVSFRYGSGLEHVQIIWGGWSGYDRLGGGGYGGWGRR